jgi:cell volume regulation protein A
VEVFELRLPDGANVTMVVRDGHGFVPGPNTVLRRGDQLLVVTTAETRDTAESRLRAVSREGRLAGWPVHEPKRRLVRARSVVWSPSGPREGLAALLRRR